MLLALLLHLLVFHLLTARDVPARKDTGFVVRHIDKCPNVGYYFKRETPPNSVGPGVCYLCFCQRDRTAICWKRENKRCDKLSFHHREIGSQDARQRRSLGLSEFFREASKDFFIKQSKPECKPFESTFSEDCPPVDWCTGCTVCDCNANGKWDCHLLSFCADEKKQKQSKGARRGVGRKYGKKPKTSTTKTTATVKPKPVQNNKLKPLKNNKPTLVKNNKPKPMKNNKPTVKAKNKATVVVKHGNNNKTQAQRIIRKSIPHKMNSTTTPVKRRTPIRYKRISTGKSETTKKMIKKNVVTHKPIEIKTTKHNLEMIIAQKLMQKVMGKLRKSVAAEMKNMSMLALETVKRERMKYLKKPSGKPKGKSNQAPKTPKTNPGRKPMYKPAGKQTKTTKNYIRNKRDLNAAAISVIPINASIEHFLGTPNVTEALPFTQMSSNLVVPDNDNDNTSHTVGSSTLPENEYYKYVVGNEEHKTKANAPLWDAATTRVNITETVFDLIGAPLTSYASTEKESIRKKKRKFSILRYLKKIFNKIFKREKPNRLSKHHLIETLCENFGPCRVSAVKGVNNSVEIENFSRNIIQNLRKLKRLAHTVSSSGRIKREISGDDDAIEYLLMLMEYLIKQNHPLDAAPVNDGIDLLIEAIKNAPDIKPIKKKVLEYTPATYSDETTYPTTITAITENTFTEDDNPSDSEKSSSEDSGKMKLEDTELKLDENKEFVDMVTDDDKDPEENNQYDRQAGNMKVGEITETSYFNRLEQNIAEPENDMETTTPMPMEMDLSDKQDSQDDVNIGKTLTIEQKNLGKATRAESRTRPRAEVGFKNEADVDAVGGADVEAEPAPEAAVGAVMRGRGEVVSMSEAGATDIIDMNEKKFEVLAGDIDEEANFSTTTPITGTESPTAVPTEFHSTESETIKPKTKMRRLNLESYDSESLDKKSKLEWIEENFGKNIPKDFTDIDESNNTTTDATIKYLTDKSTEKQVTEKLDVSNLTKEAAEEAEKNKIKTEKQSAEDVMLRKQMDLLNSLDYGTEKGETLEPDSKDTNAEDRYSGDTFPSYFI
ncbi:unnamed protein product [Spodoptera exigua]|nr:unnamed protein product [Spodoptera exigua]